MMVINRLIMITLSGDPNTGITQVRVKQYLETILSTVSIEDDLWFITQQKVIQK